MGQIFFSKKITSKVFEGTTMKEAYLKACKWYASKIISNENLSTAQVEFVKSKTEPKVMATIYVSLPEKEVKDLHCECCKEMHKAFFINQSNDCNRCSMLGYRNRLENKINVKAGFYKEHMKG